MEKAILKDLDKALRYINIAKRKHTDFSHTFMNFESSQSKIVNGSQEQSEYNLGLVLFLESEGLIVLKDNIFFQVTIKGKLFLAKTGVLYHFKNRPFEYANFLGNVNFIWKVVKVIGVVLNAVAIIALTYLQVFKK